MRIDLVDRAPTVCDVHEPVLYERRAFKLSMGPYATALAATQMKGPRDLQILDSLAIDFF